MTTRPQKNRAALIACAVTVLAVGVPSVGWAYVASYQADAADTRSGENEKRLDTVEQGLVRIETRQEAQVKIMEHTIETLDRIETHLRKGTP